MSGYQTKDGQQAVEVTYSIDGVESQTLRNALGYTFENETGLPYSADTIVGGGGLNASKVVTSADDLDGFSKEFADIALITQDDANAQIKYWGIGDGYTTSLEEYRAYNRAENAADRAVNAMVDNMTFKSDEDMAAFFRTTMRALTDTLLKGGNADLSAILKGVPLEALQAATKINTSTIDAQKLVKLLESFIADNKEQLTNQKSNGIFQPPRRSLFA